MSRGLSDRGHLRFLFIPQAIWAVLSTSSPSRSDLLTVLGRDVLGHTALAVHRARVARRPPPPGRAESRDGSSLLIFLGLFLRFHLWCNFYHLRFLPLLPVFRCHLALIKNTANGLYRDPVSNFRALSSSRCAEETATENKGGKKLMCRACARTPTQLPAHGALFLLAAGGLSWITALF